MSCNQTVIFYRYNTDTHHLLFCGLLLCSCIPHDRSDISTALCSLNYNVLRLVHSHYSLTIPLQVPDSLLTDYYIINSGFFHIYKIIRSNSTIYTKDVRQENLNYGYIQRWIKENYWEHLKKPERRKIFLKKLLLKKLVSAILYWHPVWKWNYRYPWQLYSRIDLLLSIPNGCFRYSYSKIRWKS